MTFDPDSASRPGSGIFGLPNNEISAALVFLPVPWEVTTSYGGGTSEGPGAILKASRQVDLFDHDVLRPYDAGLFMLEEDRGVRKWNQEGKRLAQTVVDSIGRASADKPLDNALQKVNALGEKLNQFVFSESERLLKSKKLIGIVGGDHSVPFGAFQAIAGIHSSFGVLHFDAHSDTRKAYEGFKWSHASIMYNVLEEIPQVKRLVQVGIRDYCEEEFEFLRSQKERVKVFHDSLIKQRLFEGAGWKKICHEIVESLPKEVWISFDIDGLDPRLCPNTGTPVPGGLDFSEATYLIGCVVRSGKKIVGFDLSEVAPPQAKDSEWDANVGARLLYKLAGWTLASQGKCEIR